MYETKRKRRGTEREKGNRRVEIEEIKKAKWALFYPRHISRYIEKDGLKDTYLIIHHCPRELMRCMPVISKIVRDLHIELHSQKALPLPQKENNKNQRGLVNGTDSKKPQESL